MNSLRHDFKIALLAAAVTAVIAAPTGAVAAYVANADRVDQKHAVGAGASSDSRAGKLVATNSEGKLPNNIINKAADSARLGGKTLRQTQMQWLSVNANGTIAGASAGASGVTVTHPTTGTYCVSSDDLIRPSVAGSLQGDATSYGSTFLHITSLADTSSCPGDVRIFTYNHGPFLTNSAFTLHFAMQQ